MLIGTKKKKLGKIERWAVGKETYLKVDFSAIQLWAEKANMSLQKLKFYNDIWASDSLYLTSG